MKLDEMFEASKDTDTHRICGTCGESKPLSAFYKDGKDSRGNVRYRRDCRDCYKTTRLQEAAMRKSRKYND